MTKKSPFEASRRPRVALIVETSLVSGREILRGIAGYVREHGPWSIYHQPRSLEASVPVWLKTWRGDGIIARLQNEKIAAAVAGTALPAVDVLGVMPGLATPLVHVNNDTIGRLAASHLLDRGFRHFAYCGLRGVNWSEERREAFQRTAAAAGFQVDVEYLAESGRHEPSWESQQVRLARWVRELPKPVGVMACYDPVGQQVLEACRRSGVLVPDVVAVIGVDNDSTVCEICDPPLSSVMADHVAVGYQAAGLLDRLMRGETVPDVPIYVAPLGVAARQSTDVLAIDDADVVAAVRFIREHACNGIDVSDVVQHVAVSHSTLKRRFRHLLGRSLHDEIVGVRIKRAQELLAQTDMPIRLVAQRAGFGHQEYLGAVFKATFGRTPCQYRRESQGH